MASIKKLFPSTPSRKAQTRPSSMRSYRVESALSIGLEHQGQDVADDPYETGSVIAADRNRSARVQQQWVISFVVVIAMLALLAGLYLNITASASIAGRQIQSIEAEISVNEQVNADLETKIATLMSNSVLEKRAEALGFAPVAPQTLQYMVVPGYFPRQAVNMVSPVTPHEVLTSSPEYTETLIDWFAREIQTASIPLVESNH